MNFEPGQRIGDYEVLGVLGRGGMGSVYKVRNIVSNRVEAMKLLHDTLSGDANFGERFLREIRVLAEMKHPHIAGLLTAQRLEGRQLAMLMEFVEGESLQDLLTRQTVPLDDAIRYACEVLDALGYAHNRGVVHRDVKPANILIDKQNRVHLTDFGIARGADYQLTEAGNTVGSIHYMSPEQIRAEDLDGRSDIYAVGITLYEMATRKKPFEGQSHFSIMASHLNENPRPPIELDPTLPAALNDIILTAIQKDRNQRFGTAAAMRHALESLRETKVEIPAAPVLAPTVPVVPPAPVAQAASLPQQPPAPSSRRGLYMAAGALAAVAAIVAIAVVVPHWGRTQAGADPQKKSEQAAESVVTRTPEPPPDRISASTGEPAAAAKPAQQQQPASTQRVTVPPPAVTTSAPAQLPPAGKPAPVPTVEAQPASQAPAPQSGPPATTTPAAPAKNPEIDRLRDRLNTLAVRFGAVRQGLENLKRQQAAMGLGTRSDFLSAERQATRYFDEAESALNTGDAAKAGERLNLAERSLAFLEDKLGR